jgi:hypothetical protein
LREMQMAILREMQTARIQTTIYLSRKSDMKKQKPKIGQCMKTDDQGWRFSRSHSLGRQSFLSKFNRQGAKGGCRKAEHLKKKR